MSAERVRAAVLTGPRRIELAEFDRPPVGEDDGILDVESCGVCGSDLTPYRGEMRRAMPPTVLGHELVGRIGDIGPEAARRWGVAAGDRVVVEETIPCGTCRLCQQGLGRMCDGMFGTPGSRYGLVPVATAPALWGGYAEAMYLHPLSVVHRLPEAVPAAVAPLFGPVANGIEWVQLLGGATIGATVVIIGPGQHGLGCVVAAASAGAAEIVVIGRRGDEDRLEVAAALGATRTIVSDDVDVRQAVAEVTDGLGADIVLDVAAGGLDVPGLALKITRPGGRVVLAGVRHYEPLTDFVGDRIVFRGLTVVGAYGHRSDAVRAAVNLLARSGDALAPMATHSFSVGDTDTALRTLGGEEVGGRRPIHVTVHP